MLDVDSRISANLRVPVIFKREFINLEEAHKQGIEYEIHDDHVLLHLKGLLDSGSCDHIIGEDLGRIVHKGGRTSTIHSVLDDNKSYKAREVDGFFISGFATCLFVKEMVKPQNSVLIMNVISNQLRVPEEKRREFNRDDKFLRRPVEIIVGIKECQMYDIEKESVGLCNSYLHPKLQLMKSPVGQGMFFMGQIGADPRDLKCPIKLYSDRVKEDREEFINKHKFFSSDGIRSILDDYLLNQLVQHIHACHPNDVDLFTSSNIICEISGIKPSEGKSGNCRKNKVPGKAIFIHGCKLPQGRCELLEDLVD